MGSLESSPAVEFLLHPLHKPDGTNKKAVERKDVKILSYNLFLRPPLIKNNQSDYKEARLSEFIKRFPDFDILCLQEVFQFVNFRKRRLLKAATDAGLLYHAESATAPKIKGFLLDGGLVILSRFPIVASDFRSYPRGYDIDNIVFKGVLYAKIKVADEHIHVFNTHTQPRYKGIPQLIKKMEQMSVFREFMVDCLKANEYKKGEIILALGDMNTNSLEATEYNTEDFKDALFLKKKFPRVLAKDKLKDYETLVDILSGDGIDNVHDLLFQRNGFHPITFGETYIDKQGIKRAHETVLTDKHGQGTDQSIDYIFHIEHEQSYSKDLKHMSIKQPNLQLVKNSTRVEKFWVNDLPFTQLSDHYGISTEISYTPK